MNFFLVKTLSRQPPSCFFTQLAQHGNAFPAYGLVLAQDVNDWYYLFINKKS